MTEVFHKIETVTWALVILGYDITTKKKVRKLTSRDVSSFWRLNVME